MNPSRASLYVVCFGAFLGAGLLLSMAGCGPSAETSIRTRFDQFSGHLFRGELDACIPFIEPARVKAAGTDGIKFALGFLQAAIKLGNLKEGDIRCDKVEVAADGKTASVHTSMRINGEWKTQPAGRWVLVDGQWYFSP